MHPYQVQFLSGIADNFLVKVLIGQKHVQQTPQWYGETASSIPAARPVRVLCWLGPTNITNNTEDELDLDREIEYVFDVEEPMAGRAPTGDVESRPPLAG